MQTSRVMETILIHLYQNKGVKNIRRLVKSLDKTYTHVYNVVKRLEDCGLLNTKKPEGTRSRKVFLSEKGKKVGRALTNYYEIFEEQMDVKPNDFKI